jgi:competence ComEA-like helix-hairpin-helix protein
MSIYINSADSATWESLPGIGPALAHRIVSYREKLGGFVSVNQLSEVWNLPDSVFQKIKYKLKFDGKVRKLNLNQSRLEEFGRHPYFGFRLAKMIVNYREQHGLFQTLEDIQKIAVIDKNKYDRISSYLTIESHTP